jgi:hypothetical protein
VKRISFHLREVQVIRNDKYGFKRGHPATHIFIRYTERITGCFNKSNALLSLFLGIERVFDKVWITGLIPEHITVKTLPHLTCLIHDFSEVGHFLLCMGVIVQDISPSQREITLTLTPNNNPAPSEGRSRWLYYLNTFCL